MLRSPSSDPSTPTLPPLTRKRLFPRVPNPLSSNGKPGPLLDANPPPVVRPSPSETKKSRVGAIKTRFQSAGAPLKLLRRFSASNGRDKPHITFCDTPPSSKAKAKPGLGRSHSLQLSRPPSLARSLSAPDAANLRQSSISPTLSMSDSDSHSSASDSTSTLLQDVHFPIALDLQTGITLTKVSAKESKKVTVRIDADLGQIFYQSRRTRISESPSSVSYPPQSWIPWRSLPFNAPPQRLRLTNSPRLSVQIENIKELRSGSDARYYRQQFGLTLEAEAKWLTVIYVMGAGYKTLHLISADVHTHQMLDITLRKLQAIREGLKDGSGGLEMRQAIWEKQYWKSSDEEKDQKLDFRDVEKMCHRLNLDPPRHELKRRFEAADEERKGTLDFAAFRRFIKALKARPELERIFYELTKESGGKLTFPLFLKFMRNTQKVCWLCTSLVSGLCSSFRNS